MSNWKDSRAGAVRDRADLAHQCRGRALTEKETAFAQALSTAFRDGAPDFDAVAATLAERGVVAPVSGRADWTVELLQQELTALNADLDSHYRDAGYGA